jgi:lysozyme
VTTNRTRATGALAAALIVATPFIAAKEGKRNNPYLDTVGVLTVCYGETRVPMRRYSDAECLAQFNKALGEDFGPAVLKCTPGIADRPRVLASAISLAYNIGVSGYCRSTAAKRFNQGRIVEGCHAYMLWNRPPEIIGRRRKERDLCLSGAA